MNKYNFLRESYHSKPIGKLARPVWERFHIDMPLFLLLCILITAGLFILYSAGNQNIKLVSQQMIRFGVGFIIMFIFAQIPPRYYSIWAPWIFGIGVTLLVAVLIVGHIGKGAQRWLGFGVVRFQPSEIMKLAMPMTLAWLLSSKTLPPSKWMVLLCGIFLIFPVLLIREQPDLGTAIIVLASGISVLLLAGMSWRIVTTLFLLFTISIPVVWHFMHGYQRLRVITFFNPQHDPLGAGYHITQSKIAIGSGGFFGKGWLNGTQSHLQFLPLHATDFIFSVTGEELGFVGAVALLAMFLAIVIRSLYISSQAQDTFSRLLAGGLSLTFFISFFVNIGMVSGILPVVGLPLPLVSYGGTSMVTILAGFGIIMSIHAHRKLLGS
jgi:rod shape determining protein RodA